MSEENQNPLDLTSSIPLKKETVRVTLKASDVPIMPPTGAPTIPSAPVVSATPTAPLAAPAPPAILPPSPPAATLPPVAPTAPKAPGAPIAPAPMPTVPLKTAGPPTARPAASPTIKLNTSSGPTVPMRTATLSTPTAPAPGPTISLPKATVQLQPPTQPLSSGPVSATQMATFKSADDEEEESKENTLSMVLSIFSFLAACGVVAMQYMTSNIWTEGTFGKLFE